METSNTEFKNEASAPQYELEVKTMGFVPYEKVKRMLASVEHHFQEEPERLNDLKLSFEYVIASCFPDAYAQMNRMLADAHTMGYISAIREMEQK